METAAVLGGADSERAQERPAHRLGGAEAAGEGNRRHRLLALLQPPASRLQAQALHVAGGREANLGAEAAREVARAHVGELRERLDRQVGREVLHRVALHLAQAVTRGRTRGERGAELRLVARPAQEQHQVARDRERRVAVEILLDHRQREVHAGGDARRGPHLPVAHEDRLGIDLDPRVAPRELRRRRPVRGRAAPVQQAGRGEQERPGAHRGDAAGGLRASGDPLDQRGVGARLLRPGPAGDEQRVDPRGRVVEAAWGTIVRPLEVHHGSAVGADDGGGVATVGAATVRLGEGLLGGRTAEPRLQQLLRPAEHLQRPGHVQALDARVDEDHDVARGVGTGHR